MLIYNQGGNKWKGKPMFKIKGIRKNGENINCNYDNENLAKQAFKDSFENCNWTILYEIKNGEKKILDYYKKENKKIC